MHATFSKYRKMRKLVYLDEQNDGALDVKDDGVDGSSQGQPDSIGLSTGSVEFSGGPDSSGNSLASFRSQSTGNAGSGTPGGTPGPSPSRRARPPIPPQMRNGSIDEGSSTNDEVIVICNLKGFQKVNTTMIRVGDDGGETPSKERADEDRSAAGESPEPSRVSPPLILPPQRDVKACGKMPEICRWKWQR